MLIKQALSNLRTRLPTPSALANKILVPIILLSSLKNYLFSTCQEQLFPIPDSLLLKTSEKSNKITLVLDMDETLIYSRSQECPSHPNYFEVHGKKEHFYVEKRPHLNEFLEAAGKVFTIYVYTAGKKQYADSILDVVDGKKVIEKRFYRDSCVKVDGSFVKDLGKLKAAGGKEKRMVLLDDNKDSIRLNAPNSLHSPPYEGGERDCELPRLFQQLLKFYDN